MYKNILVCLDGSNTDTQVILMGIGLAKKLNARLNGFTVQDRTMLEGPLMYDISGALAFIPQMNLMEETRKALQERAKNILAGFSSSCEKAGIEFETQTASGVVYKEICAKAELNDITIIGRRGLHYSFDKDLLGSTADRVVRHTQSPVLVASHEFETLKNPLIAYDGSHPSKISLKTAAQLCHDLQLPLTVLHVGDEESKAKNILNEAKEYLEAFQLTVKYEHVAGNPHQLVSQYAKKHNHDLVVLGPRGHRGLLEFILGSTTQYTLWSGGFHVLVDR